MASFDELAIRCTYLSLPAMLLGVLAIYRRHQSPCKHTSRRFRHCKCPIWVQGSLRGAHVRRSLDLRSWEAASELVRGWEASGEVGVVKSEGPTVAEAVTKLIEDANARHLAAETVRKYKNLLERRFVGWCETKGFRLLKQIDVGAVREFRTTWDDGAGSMNAVSHCTRTRYAR